MVENKIYWTTSNITKSATQDGNDTRKIFVIPSWSHYYRPSILSIDVHGDYVYHSDTWRNSYVSKVNKSGGLQYDTVASVSSSIGDIKIYHGTGKYT